MSQTAIELARQIAADAFDKSHGGRMAVSQRMRDGQADDHDMVQCALSALHAKAGVSVEVKELEWVAGDGETADNLYFEAKTIAGTYWVISGEWGHRETETHGMFDTDAEAFAAAEAHYETRIRSALSTKLQEPVGEVSGDTIMKSDVETMIRSWQSECKDHPALHNQGNVLLSRLEVLKPSLAMNDFLSGMDSLAHQPVTAGLERVDDMLSALRDSIHGDCYMGERWEQEQIDEIRMALAALKSEGRNDG